MQLATGPETILASAKRNMGTGNSSTIQTTSASLVRVYTNVVREQGVATLNMNLQTSVDKSNWITMASFTEITATGDYYKDATNPGLFFRVTWAIGGTGVPQFTFDLKVVRFEESI